MPNNQSSDSKCIRMHFKKLFIANSFGVALLCCCCCGDGFFAHIHTQNASLHVCQFTFALSVFSVVRYYEHEHAIDDVLQHATDGVAGKILECLTSSDRRPTISFSCNCRTIHAPTYKCMNLTTISITCVYWPY